MLSLRQCLVQAAIKADILAYCNLLMKDINIGGVLLSVEG